MTKMRMAAFLVALTMMLSGLAMAQYRDRDDDDDSYYSRQGNFQQARQYGYQNGYRDGYAKGRHEGEENDPNDYQTPDWRQATRGYQAWMGPVNVFQSAYRDGYRNGFGAGFTSVNRGWGDGDRDDSVYNGGWYPGGYPNGGGYYQVGRFGNPAYNIGYQDGSQVAREDVSRGKPYNPNPRGPYDDADHGYRSEYGSKSAYKAQYSNGYRTGYQASFGR